MGAPIGQATRMTPAFSCFLGTSATWTVVKPLAMLSPLGGHVLHIVGMGAEVEVISPDAWGVIALV